MKKQIIVTIAIAACIALCAAVWPQSNPARETPVPAPTPAVCAPEKNVAELKTEVKTTPLAEKEKAITSQIGAPHENPTEPEPTSIEPSAASVAQPTAESEVTQEVDHKASPEPTLKPDNEQTVVDQQSNDMVYVPGFGWIESQGPNQVEYAEDMYENGNKIGSMG